MDFSTEEKLKELDRELMQRRRVYRRLIDAGKLTQSKADRQIAILTAIAKDYRDQSALGPLFNQNR